MTPTQTAFTMKQGDVMSLRPVSIDPRVSNGVHKSFQKKDHNTYYVFDVVLENKNRDRCVCEYLSLVNNKTELELNVFQFIRCGFVSPKGTPEVEAAEPESSREPRILPNKNVQPGLPAAGNPNPGQFEGDTPPEINCYSVPIQGRSIAFATGYAKDILVAWIDKQQEGYVVTEADVRKMMGWADIINEGMCQRVKF